MELINQTIDDRDGSNIINIKHQKNLETLKNKNNKRKGTAVQGDKGKRNAMLGSFSSAASLYHKIALENYDDDNAYLSEDMMAKK